MNFADKLLKDYGLKYEELNYEEREYIRSINLGHKGYSLADMKEDMRKLKDSIALQLTETPDDEEHRETNTKLKARLKNYMVLYAKLSAPAEAEKALRRALENKGVEKSPVSY